MNRTPKHCNHSLVLAILALAATSYVVLAQDRTQSETNPRQTVIIQLSTGPDDVFTSTIALRMAEEALGQRKRVILYLEKRGVRLAMPERTDQLRLGDEDPLWFILDKLARRRGMEIIVCGESAYKQGLFPRDFMHYTLVADSPGTILQRVDRNTVVFSY